MQLTDARDIAVIQPDPKAESLIVGMSSAVIADMVLAARVRTVVDEVRPAFDPACAVSLVGIEELAEGPVAGRVVAVADGPTAVDTRRVIALGASGVLDRRSDRSMVEAALSAAVAGLTVIPPGLAGGLLTRLDDPPPTMELRPRELDLLQSLAAGMTLEQVASKRGRSPRTIRRELRQLWPRMGVTCRAQGLVRAARWGLVE